MHTFFSEVLHLNAVVVAIIVMVALSLLRVSVVFALIIAAMVGGLLGGLGIEETLKAFKAGLGGGAENALSYAVLGAFAVALSRSGLAELLINRVIQSTNRKSFVQSGAEVDSTSTQKGIYFTLLAIFVIASFSSQNIIPIHIAFIPILIPPLLGVMNRLNMDRRLAACALTFGLVGTYMFVPLGFGQIFLNQILLVNMNTAAKSVLYSDSMIMPAMLIPYLGMVFGLLLAAFYSYRKPRNYVLKEVVSQVIESQTKTKLSPFKFILVIAVIVATVVVQVLFESMVLAGLLGFALLSAIGVFRWNEQDTVFIEGVRMMALIGFIMIAAQGFASVMNQTGEVAKLVETSYSLMGDSKGLAAFIMLFVGLLITMGIGSSFSTVPIITVLYVPLCIQLGFSPLATIAIVGTAAALGDAGSPASDSTLGPTSGLNADGQHDHMWDTVVPTFLHFNIPLLVFGWVAAMVL